MIILPAPLPADLTSRTSYVARRGAARNLPARVLERSPLGVVSSWAVGECLRVFAQASAEHAIWLEYGYQNRQKEREMASGSPRALRISVMANRTQEASLSGSRSAQVTARQRRVVRTIASNPLAVGLTSTKRQWPETVFDLLYDQYLPFRLYAGFMLGSSVSDLAKQFSLSEDWVKERIEAMRLCVEKQVRLNLLDSPGRISACC